MRILTDRAWLNVLEMTVLCTIGVCTGIAFHGLEQKAYQTVMYIVWPIVALIYFALWQIEKSKPRR
jgi:hypothetical protein